MQFGGALSNVSKILIENILGGKERGKQNPYRFVTRVNI
jgi:hypothetical protein